MPLEATKSTHKAARDLFKACMLGVQYGMGPDSLALRIGRSTPYAKELLRHHKKVYQKYWAWCDHVLDTTLLFRRITTCFGWQMHIFGGERRKKEEQLKISLVKLQVRKFSESPASFLSKVISKSLLQSTTQFSLNVMRKKQMRPFSELRN